MSIPLTLESDQRRNGPVRRSLHYSMWDGSFSALAFGLVDPYFVPFALALGATAAQIGNLAALPSLVGALMQNQAAFLVEAIGGKKAVLRMMVMAQAASLLFMPLVLLLPRELQIVALLGLVTGYMVFGGLAAPLYGAMLAEYLPSTRRSGYFGWRSRILGTVMVSGTFLAGIWLNQFGKNALIGFAVLFWVAGVCRFTAWRFQEHLHEFDVDRRDTHTRPAQPEHRFGSNFRRFVLFSGLLMGAVNLSAPFFPVHLLQGLEMSYARYTWLVVGSQATMYYMMALWGRQADVVGNLRIIRAVAGAMPLIPLCWVAARTTSALFLIQVVAGVLWAGYNLCTTNFIYDAVPSAQRVRATVIFNIVNGVMSFIGAWLGGQLLTLLPPVFGQRFYTLALLSMAVQTVVVLALLSKIQETRTVLRAGSFDVFYSVLGIRPLISALRDGLQFVRRGEG